MTESEVFQKDLEAKAIEPFNNFGADMDKFAKESIQEIADLSREIGILK
jgi:putative tricarboxylic transport membrane protein